jgi:hypothetical protein
MDELSFLNYSPKTKVDAINKRLISTFLNPYKSTILLMARKIQLLNAGENQTELKLQNSSVDEKLHLGISLSIPLNGCHA